MFVYHSHKFKQVRRTYKNGKENKFILLLK